MKTLLLTSQDEATLICALCLYAHSSADPSLAEALLDRVNHAAAETLRSQLDAPVVRDPESWQAVAAAGRKYA